MPRIGRGRYFLGAKAPGERADELIDRAALLGAGGEVESPQRCVGVVAGRLENLVEEIVERLLEARHLRRKAEQQYPRIGRRLVLQAIELLLAQALQQQIELNRHLADQIARLVVGLEGRAPDLLAAGLVEITEIFDESGHQVALGEQ